MTNEQAIDIIKCLAWHDRPDEESIEQAIKALEQQPSDDCIARQPLIDNWNSCADMLMDEGDSAIVMDWIFDAPPITPIQRWIPVSERLPEEDEDVLITYKRLEKRVVGMAYRQPNNWRFENDRWISNKLVMAWQPLPKPYEEK